MTKFLEMLNDGRWHALKEIQKETGLDERRMQQVLTFLKEYNFVTVSETKKEIKLVNTVRKFLVQNSTA